MGSPDVEAQLAALAATVQSGFAAIQTTCVRIEAKQDVANGKVARAHERLSGHDVSISWLRREVERSRRAITDVAGSLQRLVVNDEKGGTVSLGTGDDRRITHRDVRLVLLGGGAMVAAWKFLEWGLQKVGGP